MLRPTKGINIRALKEDGEVIVTIIGSKGRMNLKKGIKVVVTIGRGTWTDASPIVYWIFFSLLIIGFVLLLIVAIVLTFFVVKKLKN